MMAPSGRVVTLVALLAAVRVNAQPSDWQARIDGANMAFTTASPEQIGEGYFPVTGNGMIAIEQGPFQQMWQNSWPWRSAGMFHMAGVYNGYNFTTPSHRAQLPKISNVVILAADPPSLPTEAGAEVPSSSGFASAANSRAGQTETTFTTIGAAIDYGYAVYYNRTGIDGPQCANTIIEQRSYAHRQYRDLFVFEFRGFAADDTQPWVGCNFSVFWDVDPTTPDAQFSVVAGNPSSNPPTPTLWSGYTMMPEEPGLPLRNISMAFDSWLSTIMVPVAVLTVTADQPTITVLASLHSDLDTPAPATAAATNWSAYHAMGSAALLQSHVAAWDTLWGDGGIEIAGNSSLAATVNASMYDILSALRSDWNWNTGPGGLGTGGYCGHSFWDMETWMFPVLTLLHPDITLAVTKYRAARLNASMQRAATNGYDGAFWAWESAFTGLDSAPWRDADMHEQHISADIPLAMRKYFYATGDKQWLQDTAWPVLNQTCAFWACRFTRTNSSNSISDAASPAGLNGGYGPACSSKAGTGNWTVKQVICPDESSGIIDDSIYTNAAAAQTLGWCIEAAGVLGYSDQIPAIWSDMASAPYLPLNESLYVEGPVHNEYTGYAGKTINQADVALLQYPLGLTFDSDLMQRDLDFWSTKTDFGGMFTGDSAYSCAYLALGNRSAADAQLSLAFAHMNPYFNVFHETADDSGTQHFITGNGGYLQNFVFGYPGLRIARLGVLSFTSLQPLLPPLGVTSLKLRGLHLLGSTFDFWYDDTQLCVSLQAGSPASGGPLELRIVGNGTKSPITTSQQCVPVQAVEVAGVGFP